MSSARPSGIPFGSPSGVPSGSAAGLPSGSAAGAPSRSARAGSAPAPTAAELLDFARRAAADRDLVGALPLDADGRTWVRLSGPGGAEAWLIGWPPGAETGWHDHGGSYGAFVTAAGELTEQSLSLTAAARRALEPFPGASGAGSAIALPPGLDRRRVLPEGAGRAFGRDHIHQVVNRSPGTHAVSVHAYYPPLPLIRRYSRTGGTLRLEIVERPEEW